MHALGKSEQSCSQDCPIGTPACQRQAEAYQPSAQVAANPSTWCGSCMTHPRTRPPDLDSGAQVAAIPRFSNLKGCCRGHACTQPPDRCRPARHPSRRRAPAGCSWPRRARTGPGCAPAPGHSCALELALPEPALHAAAQQEIRACDCQARAEGYQGSPRLEMHKM